MRDNDRRRMEHVEIDHNLNAASPLLLSPLGTCRYKFNSKYTRLLPRHLEHAKINQDLNTTAYDILYIKWVAIRVFDKMFSERTIIH